MVFTQLPITIPRHVSQTRFPVMSSRRRHDVKYVFCDDDDNNINNENGDQSLEQHLIHRKEAEDPDKYKTPHDQIPEEDLKSFFRKMNSRLATKFLSLIGTVFYCVSAVFDPFNDLVSKLSSKLSSPIGKLQVAFLDWDRTIFMEEGLFCPTDPNDIIPTFKALATLVESHAPTAQDYQAKYLRLVKPGYMEYLKQKYADVFHNAEIDAIMENTSFRDWCYFCLGGKERVIQIRDYFNRADVLPVIISNNDAFGRDPSLNMTPVIRAILDSIGVNRDKNVDIVMVCAGAKSQEKGGLSKIEFINAVIRNNNIDISMTDPDALEERAYLEIKRCQVVKMIQKYKKNDHKSIQVL